MKKTLPLILPLILLGCSPHPPDPFPKVQSLIHDRLPQHLEWNRDPASNRAITQTINELLSHPLTVNDAVQIALLNNPTLQSTYESVGLAQSDLLQASLLPNPTLDLSAQFPTNGGKTRLDAGLSQNLLGILFIPLRKKLAAATLQHAQLTLAHSILQTALDTQIAYYTLASLQQQLSLRQQSLQARQAILSLTRLQHTAGTITDLELTTQQSSYDQASLSLLPLTLQLQSAQESLNRQLGLSTPPTRWTLSPSPLPTSNQQLATSNSLESLALSHRLDLAAARADITLAQTALSLSHQNLITTLTPGVGVERDVDNSLAIGPSLSLDLPLFNQNQPQIARYQSLLRQSQQHYRALESTIRSQVRLDAAQLESTRTTLKFYQSHLLPESHELYHLTLLHFNAMTATLDDLLTARTNEFTTQEQYQQTLRDHQIARATLEHTLSTPLPTK